MLKRIRQPLERLGRNFIEGVWRIGVMARFFGLVLACAFASEIGGSLMVYFSGDATPPAG